MGGQRCAGINLHGNGNGFPAGGTEDNGLIPDILVGMIQAIRPARFRFCGASFGSPGTPPSGAFNIAFPAFREIAFCGQTSIQRAQLMHSWSPTCLTSMPQLRTQEPQPLHRLVSTLTPARQKRLNSP